MATPLGNAWGTCWSGPCNGRRTMAKSCEPPGVAAVVGLGWVRPDLNLKSSWFCFLEQKKLEKKILLFNGLMKDIAAAP